jgi:hypothetical protein
MEWHSTKISPSAAPPFLVVRSKDVLGAWARAQPGAGSRDQKNAAAQPSYSVSHLAPGNVEPEPDASPISRRRKAKGFRRAVGDDAKVRPRYHHLLQTYGTCGPLGNGRSSRFQGCVIQHYRQVDAATVITAREIHRISLVEKTRWKDRRPIAAVRNLMLRRAHRC